MLEQVLVHEQYGQVTGGLWSFVPGAYEVLVHADADQRRRYLEPSLRGERFGAYAVTEPNAGSDARTLETTAVRDGDGLGPQRREVVRDRPGQHRLHGRPGHGRRGRRAPADAVLRRLRHARACG